MATNLEKYLKETKRKLTQLEGYQHVHVILGNEACDLDSAVSAIVYAYYLSQVTTSNEVFILPVLNIPRDDFKLRTEITYVMKKCHLDPDWLTFRDEVSLIGLHRKGKLKATLVDCNVWPGSCKELEQDVVEIVDHRLIERQSLRGIKVKVEQVGSCCTLVADIVTNDKKFNIEKLVAYLLYCTIITDTICLNPSAKKVTDKDIAMVTELEKYLPREDRKVTFSEVTAAKCNVSELSTQELLRKDLKNVSSTSLTISMSSIPIHIKDFLARNKVEAELESFITENHAGAIVIMTTSATGTDSIERQLGVFSDNKDLQEKIVQTLLNSSVSLDLSPLTSPCFSGSIQAYSQGNIAASRKKVLPLIKNLTLEFTDDSSSVPSHS